MNSNIMSKTAIITGITGQDGAYLAQLLTEKNYKIIGTTRSYTQNSFDKLKYLKISDNVVIEEVDLADVFSTLKLINKYKPDEIYNLAAQSSVGLSFEQPIGTLQFNITSVLNILECIRIVNPKIKYYQASSSEMYGMVKSLPVTENTLLHPLSPYAISKATAFWTVTARPTDCPRHLADRSPCWSLTAMVTRAWDKLQPLNSQKPL